MTLLAVGSVALDHLEGDFGSVTDELGGSAVYFALAASLIGPVAISAPVGRDASERLRAALEGRAVDTSLVAELDAPTYRWHAVQGQEGNVEVAGYDSIYRRWAPSLPARFDGWAFVGSMPVRHQLDAARRLAPGTELLAGDSMRSYAAGAPIEAGEFVRECGWFFCTREELEALGGDAESPERWRAENGLDGVCLKLGEGGMVAVTDRRRVELGAFRTRAVDTTGAGDALAGGFLAAWMAAGGAAAELRRSLAYGVACASFAVEAVGTAGLAGAEKSELRRRAEVLLS